MGVVFAFDFRLSVSDFNFRFRFLFLYLNFDLNFSQLNRAILVVPTYQHSHFECCILAFATPFSQHVNSQPIYNIYIRHLIQFVLCASTPQSLRFCSITSVMWAIIFYVIEHTLILLPKLTMGLFLRTQIFKRLFYFEDKYINNDIKSS